MVQMGKLLEVSALVFSTFKFMEEGGLFAIDVIVVFLEENESIKLNRSNLLHHCFGFVK